MTTGSTHPSEEKIKETHVAEPISMSTPQMNYVNENSQSNMKEQRRDNNYNK